MKVLTREEYAQLKILLNIQVKFDKEIKFRKKIPENEDVVAGLRIGKALIDDSISELKGENNGNDK